jgi:hypothetical protein
MIQMVREPGSRARESLAASSGRIGRIGWETAWWLRSVRLAKHHQERYADRYLVVRYEQLFTEPERTLRDICTFLGEPFYPKMLQHGDIEAHVPERQPHLPVRDLHFIQSLGWQVMNTFGYELNHGRLSLRESLLYARDWPLNVAGFFVGMIGAGLGKRQFFHKEVPG